MIEQAARVLRAYLSTPTAIHAARALHAAGLLADSADRELRGDNNALRVTVKVHDAARRQAEARAERAEAEVDELQGRLSELLDSLTGGRMSKTNYDVRTMVQEVEAYFERTVDDEVAELRAMRDRVQSVLGAWCIGDEADDDFAYAFADAIRHSGATTFARDIIRALDGAGEQP